MDVLEHLREIGFSPRKGWSLANVRTYKANKSIDDVEIQLYVETNNEEVSVITIDMLKHYRKHLVYNKLLKSKCNKLEEIDGTINKLIEIIKKEDIA